jgi:hypothetical protein
VPSAGKVRRSLTGRCRYFINLKGFPQSDSVEQVTRVVRTYIRSGSLAQEQNGGLLKLLYKVAFSIFTSPHTHTYRKQSRSGNEKSRYWRVVRSVVR